MLINPVKRFFATSLTFFLVLAFGLIVFLGLPKRSQENKIVMYAGWNSNIEIVNILELLNSDSESYEVEIDFYQSSGDVTESQTINLKPGQQQDIILNNFRSYSKDSYGIIKITTASEKVGGRVTYYRGSSNANSFEFGFSAPLRKSMRGNSFVTFNTFNPSGDSRVVANWLSIINLSLEEQKYLIAKRAFNGQLIVPEEKITLAPFARYDYEAGHILPGSNSVGTVSITPESENAEYIANLSRYGVSEDGTSFDFAIQLQADLPKEILILPIKNMVDNSAYPLQNWLEVVNVSAQNNVFSLNFYDDSGILLESESHTFGPYSQIHFNATKILGIKNFGSVRISSQSKSLVAQSMYYLMNDLNGNQAVKQVYGSQGRSNMHLNSNPALSWNRFLEMENYLTILNPNFEIQSIKLKVSNSEGEVSTDVFDLPGYGSKVIYLNSPKYGTNIDQYGTIILNSKVIAEVVRIRKEVAGSGLDFTNQTTDIISTDNSIPDDSDEVDNDDPDHKPPEDDQDQEKPGMPPKDILLTVEHLAQIKAAAQKFRLSGSFPPFTLNGLGQKGIDGVELVHHEIRSERFHENMRKYNFRNDSETFVTFFKAKSENKNSFLRLTLIENKYDAYISGILNHAGRIYSIRPHLIDIRGRRLIITQNNSLLLSQDGSVCSETLPPSDDFLKDKSQTTSFAKRKLSNLGRTPKFIEIATDADYEKFQQYGSVFLTNAEILARMNEVDAIFKNTFNMSIKVIFQNTWDTPLDPYQNISSIERLEEFSQYWNKNLRSTLQYDYAHLFSGLEFDDALGRAYLGAVCSPWSYGMTTPERKDYLSNGREFRILAHEISHSLGAEHDMCSLNNDFVMCVEGSRKSTKFSAQSIRTLENKIHGELCLANF